MHLKQLRQVVIFFHGHIFIMAVIVSVLPAGQFLKQNPDSTKGEKAFAVDDVGAHYLRWTNQQSLSPAYTEWKQVQHPDFPDQKTEVGGLDPFALNTPPYKFVADLVKKHSAFLVKLAAYQPEVDIVNVKTEKVGSLTRITLNVINKGRWHIPNSAKVIENASM
jgi:hypothetical protein